MTAQSSRLIAVIAVATWVAPVSIAVAQQEIERFYRARVGAADIDVRKIKGADVYEDCDSGAEVAATTPMSPIQRCPTTDGGGVFGHYRVTDALQSTQVARAIQARGHVAFGRVEGQPSHFASLADRQFKALTGALHPGVPAKQRYTVLEGNISSIVQAIRTGEIDFAWIRGKDAKEYGLDFVPAPWSGPPLLVGSPTAVDSARRSLDSALRGGQMPSGAICAPRNTKTGLQALVSKGSPLAELLGKGIEPCGDDPARATRQFDGGGAIVFLPGVLGEYDDFLGDRAQQIRAEQYGFATSGHDRLLTVYVEAIQVGVGTTWTSSRDWTESDGVAAVKSKLEKVTRFSPVASSQESVDAIARAAWHSRPQPIGTTTGTDNTVEYLRGARRLPDLVWTPISKM